MEVLIPSVVILLVAMFMSRRIVLRAMNKLTADEKSILLNEIVCRNIFYGYRRLRLGLFLVLEIIDEPEQFVLCILPFDRRLVRYAKDL